MAHILTKLALAGATALVALSANAAFTPGMSSAQIDAEVKARLAKGESAGSMAVAAASVGDMRAKIRDLVFSMLHNGMNSADVVSSVIRAFGSSDDVARMVIEVAVSIGGMDRTAAAQAALAGGANADVVLAATAAGPGGNQGTGFGAGGGQSNFGTSFRSTFIGGSGGARSRT